MFFFKSRKILRRLIIFPIKWIISNAIWYFHYGTRVLRIDKILNKEFNIDPKKNKKIDSCKYCEYQELCFKSDDSYTEI